MSLEGEDTTNTMYTPLWRNTVLLDLYRAVFGNISKLMLPDGTFKMANDSDEKEFSLSDEIFLARAGINGIGGTTIAIFGIICNIIVIIVLANYRQKTSAPFLLIILAVYDTVALFSEMMLETLTLLSRAKLISRSYLEGVIPVYVVMYPVPHVAQTGSIYMTVLITVERFLAVVTPFRAMRYCNRSVAWKACLVVLAWAIIYHIPMYLAYTHWDGVWSDELNKTRIIFNRTDFGISYFYNEVYVTWINFICDFLTPFLVIAILNVLILRAMKKSKEFNPCEGRQQMNQQRDTRMTVMVLAVTTVFFVCQLFTAVAFVMMRGMNKYSDCSMACNNFTAVADTMVMVNSAVNFILYCAVGKKFREVFVQVFCGYRQAKPAATHQTNLSTQSPSSKVRAIEINLKPRPNINQNVVKRNIPTE
ncbi:FMRFamide receptor-like [Gigantopelta aegis]|uniref:FMRFamide receptor-like n=1 Tax=Gigantopelta aegis TaxID=1735272 RepID=UPI001B888144|nr:FMRFamide receptor-like [Gigantopelta aegis]